MSQHFNELALATFQKNLKYSHIKSRPFISSRLLLHAYMELTYVYYKSTAKKTAYCSFFNRYQVKRVFFLLLSVVSLYVFSFYEGISVSKRRRKETKMRRLAICSHSFHADCIDLWFGQMSTCPLCRAENISNFTAG